MAEDKIYHWYEIPQNQIAKGDFVLYTKELDANIKEGYVVGFYEDRVMVAPTPSSAGDIVKYSEITHAMRRGALAKTIKQNGNKIIAPKYSVGQKVYSWQNPHKAAEINLMKFSKWNNASAPHPNDTWYYRLSLVDSNGRKSHSKWMPESSISATDIGYANGGKITSMLTKVKNWLNSPI